MFYDFTEANEAYLGGLCPKADGSDDGEEEVWSDEEDVDGINYDEYEDNIKRAGFSVNHLGELVLPSGKTLGHRALNRYYKQRYNGGDESDALVAAKNNAAQRLGYDGYEEGE